MQPGAIPPAEDVLADPLLRDVPVHEGFKVLDPAVLYARIGQGGMGSVYRGRHIKLDLDVAVKCLKPSLAAEDPSYVRRFQREARLAASITHQNVVRVMDVNERFGIHYLVMEFVAGETARERVQRKGRLAEREAVAIVLGAATGLAVAHGHGIVHRDIKPDNVLIARDGCVKVADLGLAKAARSVDAMSQTVNPSGIMGTPQFMAPEQWDSADVTSAADVWGLGATLYYLLAGRNAIEPGPLLGIARQIQDREFPSLRDVRRDVSRQVNAVLARCVCRRPGDRFPDARALVRALRPLVEQDDDVLLDLETGTGSLRVALVTPPPREALLRIRAVIAGDRHAPHAVVQPETTGRAPLVADPQVPTTDESERSLPAMVPAPTPAAVRAPQLSPRGADLPTARIQNAIDLPMIGVPALEFVMGSPESERGRYADEHAHIVRLTQPYWLAETPVTQAQWYSVMKTMPWRRKRHVLEGAKVAATYLGWPDVQVFCERLTLEERTASRLPADYAYRLPTEAEWELACRAGTRTAFSCGDEGPGLDRHAVYASNCDGEYTHPVRTRRPNPWGFFDMHGNVWEWCEDAVEWHATLRVVADTYRDGIADPCSRNGSRRVIRGGGWGFAARDMRSAARSALAIGMNSAHVGFRPAVAARHA